jgi:hypothetical protein
MPDMGYLPNTLIWRPEVHPAEVSPRVPGYARYGVYLPNTQICQIWGTNPR